MARKGKPWGPSNPLWRWQHSRKGGARTYRKRSARARARDPSGIKRAYREKAKRERRARRARPQVRNMARRRYYGGRRRRGRKAFKIPIVTLAILAGQFAYNHARSGGDWKGTLSGFGGMYSGFNPARGSGFFADELLLGYGPWLVKGLVSKVARPLGAIPRIPFGLPISIS